LSGFVCNGVLATAYFAFVHVGLEMMDFIV
jgi:hypothetical protein